MLSYSYLGRSLNSPNGWDGICPDSRPIIRLSWYLPWYLGTLIVSFYLLTLVAVYLGALVPSYIGALVPW